MRTAMIAAALAVALHGHGRADDQTDEAIQNAANNVSAEMSVCAAFNQVMAACFLRSNFNEGSEAARKQAVYFLSLAEDLGKRANISKLNEVLVARNTIAVKDMRKSIDNDCASVSILLDKPVTIARHLATIRMSP